MHDDTDNNNELLACVIDDMQGFVDYLEGEAGDYEVANLEDWMCRLQQAQHCLRIEIDKAAE